ncbi:hypothetical protein U1Q18_025123 [Sarracenia purpurea var. burkii]
MTPSQRSKQVTKGAQPRSMHRRAAPTPHTQRPVVHTPSSSPAKSFGALLVHQMDGFGLVIRTKPCITWVSRLQRVSLQQRSGMAAVLGIVERHRRWQLKATTTVAVDGVANDGFEGVVDDGVDG